MNHKLLIIPVAAFLVAGELSDFLTHNPALNVVFGLAAATVGTLVASAMLDIQRLSRARREARSAREAHRQVMAVHRESLQAHIRREAGARIDQVATGALAPDDVNYIYRRIRSGIVNKVYKDTHRLN